MCKYASVCKLCERTIEINASCENMQDVKIKIASDCPSLEIFADNPITLDAMRELIVPKEQSDFMKILQQYDHPSECTVYESVIDAIGKELGRYYEIA